MSMPSWSLKFFYFIRIGGLHDFSSLQDVFLFFFKRLKGVPRGDTVTNSTRSNKVAFDGSATSYDWINMVDAIGVFPTIDTFIFRFGKDHKSNVIWDCLSPLLVS
jgi:hypothetical protein